jgi:hypothetical protein
MNRAVSYVIELLSLVEGCALPSQYERYSRIVIVLRIDNIVDILFDCRPTALVFGC